MNGPSFCDIMLAVPSLTWRPDADVTGRAVRAVRGVFSAASIVPGRPPDWVVAIQWTWGGFGPLLRLIFRPFLTPLNW